MALPHFHIQFFVTMLMIAGAACVALICDFRKRNNDEVCELSGDICREEDQKLARILTLQASPSQAAPKRRSMTSPEMIKPGTIKPKTVKDRKRSVNADALAVMQRGAALAGTKVRPTAAGPVPKDQTLMLSSNVQRTGLAPTILPAGFQHGHVLRNLVESHSAVTGLVVAIGVNESSDSVRGLVESLIGPNDFAAQSREDEFLLIYPDERGVAAQRKLNEIAEHCRIFNSVFWDRSESCFSWGGVEVRSESIDEAIASARGACRKQSMTARLAGKKPEKF